MKTVPNIVLRLAREGKLIRIINVLEYEGINRFASQFRHLKAKSYKRSR